MKRHRSLLIGLFGGIVINTGVISAEADCFWDLPGIKELLAGPDVHLSPPDSGPCGPAPRLLAHVKPHTEDYGPYHVTTFISNEKLLFSVGSHFQTLCMCCKSPPYFEAPYEVNLSNVNTSGITAMALYGLRASEGYLDTVYTRLLLSVAGHQIKVYDIRIGVGEGNRGIWVSETTPITLAERASNQRILGLTNVPDTNVVFAFGEGGLIRRINMSDEPRETIYDVDSTESLLCAGEGFVGSASGSIYRIGETTPVARVNGTLRTVSSVGGGGDDGLVVERVDDSWNAFDVGDMSVRHVRFSKEWYGMEAHIVDEHYQMHHVTLHDSVTRLKVDSPFEIAAALETGEYSYEGPDTLRAEFRLYDPEDNHVQPKITLSTAHGDTNLVPELNGEYVERCDDYSKGLTQPRFGMMFTPDSVVFSADCFEQDFIVLCTETCMKRSFDCRSNVGWALGDTALVIVELDTLRIIHSIPSAVRRGAVKNASSPELSRVFADLKRGIVAEGIAESIEVFTLEGRRVPLHGSGKLFLPGGTYVVRTREGNGGAMIGRLTVEKPGL